MARTDGEGKVIETEKVDDDEGKVIEAEKVEEVADEGEEKEAKTKEPPAPKKKSILTLSGLILAVLGALGVVGAVLLDPIMNMTDSNHPADIVIGTTQLMLILAAAIVVIVGIVITMGGRSKSVKG